MEEEQRTLLTQKITNLTVDGWLRIDQWGKATGKLDVLQSNFIWKVVRKIEREAVLSDKELNRADAILDTLNNESPQIMKELIGSTGG